MTTLTIKLPVNADIGYSKELYDELSKKLSEADMIEIDASETEKITTPALQLLLASSKTAPLELKAYSEQFVKCCKDLGAWKVISPNSD